MDELPIFVVIGGIIGLLCGHLNIARSRKRQTIEYTYGTRLVAEATSMLAGAFLGVVVWGVWAFVTLKKSEQRLVAQIHREGYCRAPFPTLHTVSITAR